MQALSNECIVTKEEQLFAIGNVLCYIHNGVFYADFD